MRYYGVLGGMVVIVGDINGAGYCAVTWDILCGLVGGYGYC